MSFAFSPLAQTSDRSAGMVLDPKERNVREICIDSERMHSTSLNFAEDDNALFKKNVLYIVYDK